MSAPKSVVKINKSGVYYESFADQANFYLFELTRAALRDVGRFVLRKFREDYYSVFHKNSGEGGKALKYQVMSRKNTTAPRVNIGWKTGAKGFYSAFQERGTKKQKKLGILHKVVENNTSTIKEIESQYLTGITPENVNAKINENEMEGGLDD